MATFWKVGRCPTWALRSMGPRFRDSRCGARCWGMVASAIRPAQTRLVADQSGGRGKGWPALSGGPTSWIEARRRERLSLLATARTGRETAFLPPVVVSEARPQEASNGSSSDHLG